jgi:hypothetical protein
MGLPEIDLPFSHRHTSQAPPYNLFTVLVYLLLPVQMTAKGARPLFSRMVKSPGSLTIFLLFL